jgi:Protein of unknown function (DUF2911)
MKIVLSVLAAITIMTSTSCAQGGGAPKKASPHDTLTTKAVTVTYGRPYKKGRIIFGELEKYGKVWRVGADQATEITFNQDTKFGGEGVKKGTYTLFAIPEATEWTIILNSQLGQWGAYGYEKVKDKDVLKIKVPVTKLASVVEQLTIKADNSALTIEWDQTKVSVPMSF